MILVPAAIVLERACLGRETPSSLDVMPLGDGDYRVDVAEQAFVEGQTGYLLWVLHGAQQAARVERMRSRPPAAEDTDTAAAGEAHEAAAGEANEGDGSRRDPDVGASRGGDEEDQEEDQGEGEWHPRHRAGRL